MGLVFFFKGTRCIGCYVIIVSEPVIDWFVHVIWSATRDGEHNVDNGGVDDAGLGKPVGALESAECICLAFFEAHHIDCLARG